MTAAKVAAKVRDAFASLAELRGNNYDAANAIAMDADARLHMFSLGLDQGALVKTLAARPVPVTQEK